jgi:zinc protease
MDVLSNVLGGSGGLLFLKLRDQQSLAYTVSPLHSHGCHPGLFGVYMGCSPQKLEEATQGIERLWKQLCDELLPQEEIDRARNYLIGGHEADMQRGDSQAMNMALMELYGQGYDDFDRYAENLQKVTREDVQRLARKLIEGQERIRVYVGPEMSNSI